MTLPNATEGTVLDQLRQAIEQRIPDAEVGVAGAAGHYRIDVVSPVFSGKSMLESQRLVYGAIAHLMQGDDAPVHAVDSLRTRAPNRV
jgi:acid stress-induced BolA-like protein IbaG/YrbA